MSRKRIAKFTTEHFVPLAGLIKRSKLTEPQKKSLAGSMSRIFSTSNPDYRRDVFMHACGLTKKEPPRRRKSSRTREAMAQLVSREEG